MRRRFVAFLAVCALTAPAINCSKKSAGPVAPPPPQDPACSLSPPSLAFGAVPIGSAADRALVLTNTGGGTLSGTLSESCSEFAVLGSAAYSLAAGQSDTFTVRFSPTNAGSKTCTIQTGSSLCTTVACTAEGQANTPACAVSPSFIDLGTLLYGRTRDGLFAIQNTGGGTLTGSVSGAFGDFSMEGLTTFSLGAGQYANLRVRFMPTSAGAQACTLNTAPTCTPVIVRGQGELEFTGGCRVGVTSDTVDFGEVGIGLTAESNFTLKNFSDTYIARGCVDEICPEFALVGEICFNLFPDGRFIGSARFSPTRPGPQACAMPVACRMDGEGTNPGISAYVICKGVGVIGGGGGGPLCQLSATTLNFGQVTVGQSRDLSLTVTNVGRGLMAGTAGPSHCLQFSFVGATDYSLGPGQSKTLTLRFTPSQIGHTITCSEIPMGSPTCAPLTAVGEGVGAPTCAVSVTSIDFGNVAVGQSRDLTFDLENSGGGTLCGSVTESCTDFSIVQNASYCITPPGFVRVTVRFSPTTAGFQQCTVSPGSGCAAVTVRGTGS